MTEGSPGPSLTRSPLRQIRTFGTPAARASFCMFKQMQRLAVHGDQQCGRTQEINVRAARRGADGRDVNEVGAVVITSMPWLIRPLMNAAHRLLVAGDGTRGKDHAIALVERHLRMIVIGDA